MADSPVPHNLIPLVENRFVDLSVSDAVDETFDAEDPGTILCKEHRGGIISVGRCCAAGVGRIWVVSLRFSHFQRVSLRLLIEVYSKKPICTI